MKDLIKISFLLISKLCFLALMGFLCTSFQQQVTHQMLVDNKLQEKLDRYILDQKKICERKILKEAIEKVDSMMIAQAKMQSVDTVTKPPLPIKPIKPVVKQPTETGEIKPVLDQ